MDFCLYDPEQGYYITKQEIFGPEGDYYTSPYTHQVFAYCLADAFVHYFQLLSRPGPFHLVELGAGEGFLGRDILTRLQDAHPRIFEGVNYCPVELGRTPLKEFMGLSFPMSSLMPFLFIVSGPENRKSGKFTFTSMEGFLNWREKSPIPVSWST